VGEPPRRQEEQQQEETVQQASPSVEGMMQHLEELYQEEMRCVREESAEHRAEEALLLAFFKDSPAVDALVPGVSQQQQQQDADSESDALTLRSRISISSIDYRSPRAMPVSAGDTDTGSPRSCISVGSFDNTVLRFGVHGDLDELGVVDYHRQWPLPGTGGAQRCTSAAESERDRLRGAGLSVREEHPSAQQQGKGG
jgi:hypothetical protein